jgi:hypothetical protein
VAITYNHDIPVGVKGPELDDHSRIVLLLFIKSRTKWLRQADRAIGSQECHSIGNGDTGTMLPGDDELACSCVNYK